jgi:mannose-6-phosphate isomerase-like protein (cupin superfamily)
MEEIKEIKKVPKVWGHEIWMANTSLYCGKKLILKRGKRSSLHYHKKKDETFYIDEGKILMECGNKIKVMKKGELIRIKPNTKHRFSGLENSVIIEISTYHQEADSYRNTQSGDIPREIMKKYN